MTDESNKNDKESFQMSNINTGFSLSKQKNLQPNFDRAKQWTNHLTNSIKQQRNLLKKSLTSRTTSLIRISGYDHSVKSVKKSDDIITINVSGNRYQTRLSTLETYPDTLLGNKEKRKYYWNNKDKEYFFDRHRSCFESILYYYQSNGCLRRPDYVPLDTFFEETLFFDLGSEAISQINKLENVSIIKYIDLPNCLWRRYVCFYFEYPQHSIFARIIYFISMLLTILSSITLAIETLPSYNQKSDQNICKKDNENLTYIVNDTLICSSTVSSPFFLIQTICVTYFTIEFVLRLISTPSYYRFVFSILNWIDLGAIIPYFVFIGLTLNEKEINLNKETFNGLRIFRILRFLRLIKIYLIFKQFKSLRVLSSTLKESFMDFIITIIILTLMAFLFGAAIYFAEQDINGQVFDSIPKSIYWGIMTITTVGYGDMYPVTTIGRILACFCAFFGVVTSGMLISVLVDRYQRIYNRKKFFPEQIMTAVDSSDNEHHEKQDFINRKLTSTKQTLTYRPSLSLPTTPILSSPHNNIKYPKYKSPPSHVRFIITLTDHPTNNKFLHQTAHELMIQLREIVQNTGDRIHLKLISVGTNSTNDQTETTNQLPFISEEDIF